MTHTFPHHGAGGLVLPAIGFACALVAAAVPVLARAEDASALAFQPEADLRIAELRLRERQVLLSDLVLYEADDETLLIPFDALMDVLDFRLTITADGGIEGWFLRENQRLSVNPATRQVKVAGRELPLLAGDLASIDGEWHISSAALDRWLAMGVKWDSAAQILTLAPPYLLAAEELAKRQRGGGLAGAGRPAFDTAGFTPISAPWRPICWPVVNLNAAITYDDRAGGVVVQANALAEGDLLWATGRLALVGSSKGPIDARLTLARQDPQAHLLGGVGASIIEAGDIAVPANLLLQRNAFGVGVRIGREPLGAVGEFDRTDLIGDAPPGWQAELYRDSELLGFQTIATDGRYFFPEVPVLFGVNRFRIVLYGPAGERQEISRTFDIGANLVRPGEFRYNLVAMRQGYSLFGGALTQLRSGGVDRNINLRANATLAGFSVANSLLWRQFRSQPGQPINERFDGQFSLSGGIGKLRLRGGIDYAIIPEVSARRLRGEVSYRLGDWFLAATADRDLENEAGQWGLLVNRDWNGVRLGADVRYEDARSEWRGLLTLSLSMDRDPLGGGLRFGREAVGQRGTVLASGFRDSNGNGRRDPGEETLDDVEIKVDPRGRMRRRGATIIAEELPLDRAIAVAPVLDGIDDPLLVAAARGYLVTPRAGRPVRVDIPLVESGEVVLQLAEGSGVLVELVSCATGEVTARERTAYDGQAFFTGVIPGCYALRFEGREVEITVEPGDVTRAEMSEPDR
jgi:hypothetical protein